MWEKVLVKVNGLALDLILNQTMDLRCLRESSDRITRLRTARCWIRAASAVWVSKRLKRFQISRIQQLKSWAWQRQEGKKMARWITNNNSYVIWTSITRCHWTHQAQRIWEVKRWTSVSRHRLTIHDTIQLTINSMRMSNEECRIRSKQLSMTVSSSAKCNSSISTWSKSVSLTRECKKTRLEVWKPQESLLASSMTLTSIQMAQSDKLVSQRRTWTKSMEKCEIDSIDRSGQMALTWNSDHRAGRTRIRF